MKNEYLSELRELLNQYQMEDTEKDDIITDYSDMYDNWINYGMNEDEVEEKLGSPRNIIHALTEGYKRIKKRSENDLTPKQTKIVAITPFIALVLFFIGGFVFDAWVYSWMAFLIIPVTAIYFSMAGKDPHLFTALSPFIAVTVFMILGLGYDLWHPGWMIFLIIPVIAISTEHKSMKFFELLTALSPFAAVVVYGILGFEYNLWHPGWLVFLVIPILGIMTGLKNMKLLEFLTAISPFAALVVFVLYFIPQGQWVPGWLVFLIIPVLGVLNEKRFSKILLWEVLILGGAGLYLYIGETFGEYNLALLSFVPLIAYALLFEADGVRSMPREYRIVVFISAAAFVAIGWPLNLWGWSWLAFLAIPVYAIWTETEGNAKTIALTPFVAVIIFYTLGWFFDLWAFSWLAFLIIPVVAIITEAE